VCKYGIKDETQSQPKTTVSARVFMICGMPCFQTFYLLFEQNSKIIAKITFKVNFVIYIADRKAILAVSSQSFFCSTLLTPLALCFSIHHPGG